MNVGDDLKEVCKHDSHFKGIYRTKAASSRLVVQCRRG